MKFIRDIINEKTQAAGATDPSALRYPLKLRAEDRADLAPEEEIAEPVPSEDAIDGLVHDEAAETDGFEHVDPVQPDLAKSDRIDFSAIAGAFTDAPDHEDDAMSGEAHLRDEAVASIAREPSIFDAFDDGDDEDDQDEEEIEAKLDREFGIASFEDDNAEDDAFEDEAIIDQDRPVAVSPQPDPEPEMQPALQSASVSDRMSAEARLRRNILRDEIDGTSVERPQRDQSLRQPLAAAPEPEARMPSQPVADTMRAAPAAVSVPKPASGRGTGRSGRVKTRLLGFSATQTSDQDPIKSAPSAGASEYSEFPVGWLVVVDGPGKGAAFTLFDGLTQIGRGEGQAVRLDFGDNSISRENHAAIAFDAEQGRFFFGHGGKANLVRLNGRPVLSTEDLQSGSVIRIGETTLRFIALCNDEFSWAADDGEDMRHAQHG